MAALSGLTFIKALLRASFIDLSGIIRSLAILAFVLPEIQAAVIQYSKRLENHYTKVKQSPNFLQNFRKNIQKTD
jgi:hypothetical protein